MSGTGLVTSNTMPVLPNWTTVFYLSPDLSQIMLLFLPLKTSKFPLGKVLPQSLLLVGAASRVGISWWILSAHQLANGSLVLLSGYKNKGLGAGPQKSQQWVLDGLGTKTLLAQISSSQQSERLEHVLSISLRTE